MQKMDLLSPFNGFTGFTKLLVQTPEPGLQEQLWQRCCDRLVTFGTAHLFSKQLGSPPPPPSLGGFCGKFWLSHAFCKQTIWMLSAGCGGRKRTAHQNRTCREQAINVSLKSQEMLGRVTRLPVLGIPPKLQVCCYLSYLLPIS